MRIGVPKEIKNHEYRVGLAPSSVRELVSHGHQVMVQVGAGAGIGANDDWYHRLGAQIVDDPAEIFATSEMIVKVKEPQIKERAMLRDGQILFTYFHLAPDSDQTADLVKSGAICIAYETVTSKLPDEKERRILSNLLRTLQKSYREHPESADEMCTGLKLKTAREKAQLAAWTVLINALYNLDITKTRE